MIESHTSEFLEYKLLDTCALDYACDSRLAILRKAIFRNTKDGKPFLRLVFEDVHGYVIIGRMFDLENPTAYGQTVSQLLGRLVKVSYTVDYFNGSVYLDVSGVDVLKQEVVAKYEKYFVGKYIQADASLIACNQLISAISMPTALRKFCNSYCSLDFLTTVSEESICRGLRGYILNVIYNVLLVSSSAAPESVVAFLYAVVAWVYTRQKNDANSDDSNMMFVASMMTMRVGAESQGMRTLAAKLSEFAAFFSGSVRTISADTYQMYNVWKTLVESSTIAVLESRLPVEGFCSYKTFTVRRSGDG